MRFIWTISILLSLTVPAFADDEESHKIAKEAAHYILKENPNKKVSEIALDELKKVCSNQLHKGCRFSKKNGEIFFQELDSRGRTKTGEMISLSKWLKKLFSK